MDDKPLILIIEDDVDVVGLISRSFEKAGFGIMTAHYASEGIRLAETFQPKAIILDLILARLCGFEVLSRLKQSNRTCTIPVLIISGVSDLSSKMKAFEMGVDDYILKPFSTKEVLFRLKSVLRRYQPVVQELVAGDLVVEPVALHARIKGRSIDLSLMEFKMLCILMSKKGEIIQREEIHHAIWGKDHTADIRCVDTYIYRVRKKLGEYSGMIKNVRATGYLFQHNG